jgi:hypothetical protein
MKTPKNICEVCHSEGVIRPATMNITIIGYPSIADTIIRTLCNEHEHFFKKGTVKDLIDTVIVRSGNEKDYVEAFGLWQKIIIEWIKN